MREAISGGIERVACARPFPAASSNSQPKSCAAPITVETAVRSTVDHISSVIVISRLHMISRPTGSSASRVFVVRVTLI
jgi:hypothetical protein